MDGEMEIRTYGRMDERKDQKTDRRRDRRTDRQTDIQTKRGIEERAISRKNKPHQN